jgi:hypothetical protein
MTTAGSSIAGNNKVILVIAFPFGPKKALQ